MSEDPQMVASSASPTRPPPRTKRAAAVYIAIAAVLVISSNAWPRYPLGPESLLALVAPTLAVGLLARSWWALTFVPLPFVGGIMFTFTGVEPYWPVEAGLALTVAALLLLPLAVALVRRRPETGRSGVVLALMITGLASLPLAVLQRERTVRVDRDRPQAVDLSEGTFRGVGLGDRQRAVGDALGPARRIGPQDEGSLSLSETGERITGPSVIRGGTTGEELRYGDDVAFLLDGRDRVAVIEIADRSAATAKGLGPGDSLDLFADAYPHLRCDEGETDDDNSTPYPYCYGLVAPGRRLYVGGTYKDPGEPAVLLLLSRRPL